MNLLLRQLNCGVSGRMVEPTKEVVCHANIWCGWGSRNASSCARSSARPRASAQTLAHTRILLEADTGQSDEHIAAAVKVSSRTLWRVRRRRAEQGFDAALHRQPQPARPHKRRLHGAGEAYLIALACSPPPQARAAWTLQLLADQPVELKCADRLWDETVRRVLKKTN